MELLDFPGGKYQQAEQILPGAIQTFRANDAANGRPVYVHRISLADDPLRQASLLGLLSTALLRSPKARKLVLDLMDADGFYYVVTETAPKCLLLREWLQCEVDDPSSDSEERKQAPAAPSDAITEVKPVSAELAKAAPSHSEPEKQGEFTQMFQAVTPRTEPAKPNVQEPSNPEPGEFTRYFQGGLPAPPKKPDRTEISAIPERTINPAPQRSQERSSRTGFVQRPNTPVPGEFTKLFPATGRSSKSTPGEYTRLFGSASASPVQEPSADFANGPVGERQPNKSADDPLIPTATVQRSQPPVPPAAPKGPSEYTMAIMPPERSPLPSVSPSAASGLKIPSAPSAPATAVPSAQGSRNKLILFFLILGLLAVALVVLIVLIALRK